MSSIPRTANVCRRGLSSASVDAVCAMLNHLCTAFEQRFIEFHTARLARPNAFQPPATWLRVEGAAHATHAASAGGSSGPVAGSAASSGAGSASARGSEHATPARSAGGSGRIGTGAQAQHSHAAPETRNLCLVCREHLLQICLQTARIGFIQTVGSRYLWTSANFLF